jgi:hypothetical protein
VRSRSLKILTKKSIQLKDEDVPEVDLTSNGTVWARLSKKEADDHLQVLGSVKVQSKTFVIGAKFRSSRFDRFKKLDVAKFNKRWPKQISETPLYGWREIIGPRS